MLFKQLSEEEIKMYRQWARDNYELFDPINGIYHPVVQEECVRMNEEASNKSLEEILYGIH